jgi:hypothetical protein
LFLPKKRVFNHFAFASLGKVISPEGLENPPWLDVPLEGAGGGK